MPQTLRAKNVEPWQSWRWRLEIDGLNPIAIKEVDLPDDSREVVTVADGEIDRKYRGRRKIGQLVLRHIYDGEGPDLSFHEWYYRKGRTPKLDGDLIRIGPNEEEIERRKFFGLWPSKRGGDKLKKSESGVVMGELTLEVEDIAPPSGQVT